MIEQCVKCGASDIALAYHRSDYDCPYSQRHDKGNTDEHLHLTCRTCRYGWCTPCLDSQPKEPAQ